MTAGYVSSESSAGIQEISGDTLFIGAGSGTRFGDLVVDAGLKFGQTKIESTRMINHNNSATGWERADASFDTNWGRVSLGASYEFVLNEQTSIAPMAQIAYTRAQTSGYRESGSAANASVDRRSIGVMEAELGVSVARKLGPGQLSGSLSYVLRDISGGGSMDVTLIGDQQSIKVDRPQYGAARFGLGYSAALRENLYLNVNGSFQSGDIDGGEGSAALTFFF